MYNEKLIFNELPNIDSVVCLVGLSFPDSATDFQKSALTLAHVLASVRESVLKGVEIPFSIVEKCAALATIMSDNKDHQK